MNPRRSWSIPIGRVAGIPVRLHLSFLILVALVVGASGSQSGADVAWEFGWLIAVFACVLIHELSHCVVARRYGVVVKDIMLLPIGGVSEMERIPDDAHQELAVAAAGPAASVALAAGALALAVAAGGRIWPPALMTGSILARIGWMNALLAAFNLVPALPLDGGRILRAALTSGMGKARATSAAAAIGRIGGAAMIFVGLMYDFWLVLIGAFVYLGATAEGRVQKVESALSGIPVQAAMVWPAWTADENDLLTPGPLHEAFVRQGVLPVLSHGAYAGVVADQHLRHIGFSAVAGDVVDRQAPGVLASDHLDAVIEAIRRSGHPAVAVVDPDGAVVGIVRAVDLRPGQGLLSVSA